MNLPFWLYFGTRWELVLTLLHALVGTVHALDIYMAVCMLINGHVHGTYERQKSLLYLRPMVMQINGA